MDVHIRSKRGVNAARRRLAVAARRAQGRGALLQRPVCPVRAGRGGVDAGNYAAAEAAADRALAADPKSVRALIYKGRALMELAKADPNRSDSKAASAAGSRAANKLDTENRRAADAVYRTFCPQRANDRRRMRSMRCSIPSLSRRRTMGSGRCRSPAADRRPRRRSREEAVRAGSPSILTRRQCATAVRRSWRRSPQATQGRAAPTASLR